MGCRYPPWPLRGPSACGPLRQCKHGLRVHIRSRASERSCSPRRTLDTRARNSLSTRHIVPRGVGTFDFVWTHFGYSDDDAAMRTRRLRQANLFGPAGYPYIWKLVDYPYALLTWPNGNGCYGYDNGHNPQITGRDHAVRIPEMRVDDDVRPETIHW